MTSVSTGKSLAIFSTHPIQYQVPWFQALAKEKEINVKVYYAMLPDEEQQGAGFGVNFQWDIPLLNGYEWELLKNRSKKPSLDRFRGCHVSGIAGVLKKHRPDAAVITGWHSLYLVQALSACRRLGIPTLVRGDSNTLAPRGRLKAWVQRQLIRRYTLFLAVGKVNRKLYEQAGIESKRILFCPHFVDNERFSQAADQLRPARDELRERWAIPRDAVCFLFVGKLIPKKRVLDFISAVADASAINEKVHGLIVGTGELMEKAKAVVAARNAPVSFAGFLNQDEIASAYVAADCLVLPSDHGETWGLVVNEAMACGLPAIVSDQVGCGPDLVIEGETGTSFSTGNVGALTEAIVDLARDAKRLAFVGRQAHELVISRYSITCAVNGTRRAIRSLSV